MAEVLEEIQEDIVALHNAPILWEIERKRAKKAEVQAKYDTLEDFKTKMQNQINSFDGVSGEKQLVLNGLEELQKDCNACNIYVAEMGSSFGEMVSTRMPNCLFTPFLNKIDYQLSVYNSQIISLQSAIISLEEDLW